MLYSSELVSSTNDVRGDRNTENILIFYSCFVMSAPWTASPFMYASAPCHIRDRTSAPSHLSSTLPRRSYFSYGVSCRAVHQLPDVPSILVDQLVHHGMEHDETSIRLWSTRVSSRLLVSAKQDSTTRFRCLMLLLLLLQLLCVDGIGSNSGPVLRSKRQVRHGNGSGRLLMFVSNCVAM